jgi:predicted ribosomally synthesized peptide with SipW-like signal peptide
MRTAGSRRFSLRLRAALAVGLVLGVGATGTLASWTDQEVANGSFTASSFSTESAMQGGIFASNPTSPGVTVTLSAAGFLPARPQYFGTQIRTTAASVAGVAVLVSGVVGGTDAASLGAALRLRVVRGATTCAAAAFTGSPSFVVGSSTVYRTLGAGQESGVVNLLAAATATLPGAPTGFCFEVGLPVGAPTSLQGTSATATWHFTATST